LPADEFKMAVSTWNNGAVDGFNALTDKDWTYSVTNSCGARASAPLLKSTASEVSRDPGALGAEAGESTFAKYTPVLYEDKTLPPSGTLNPASQTATTCMLNYGIMLKGKMVRFDDVLLHMRMVLRQHCALAVVRRISARAVDAFLRQGLVWQVTAGLRSKSVFTRALARSLVHAF
jgi:hypothetical protein